MISHEYAIGSHRSNSCIHNNFCVYGILKRNEITGTTAHCYCRLWLWPRMLLTFELVTHEKEKNRKTRNIFAFYSHFFTMPFSFLFHFLLFLLFFPTLPTLSCSLNFCLLNASLCCMKYTVHLGKEWVWIT